ncbi:aquaporin-7 [Protobothrops mucrosquamatus]|uniref:aquaporin-7 n=1 Tax=Protobothrops mucrosquamatus TaxID=103944 RepID=UPI0010FAD43C|nr:aquaporin-7 [Protobothrops mucrosquamatus]
MLEKLVNAVTIRNETVRQGLAEALGTFLLMSFGLGSVAQVELGKKSFGDYLSINLGFGFGVMLGVHAAGGISGAHMNASISFANCVVGNLLWRKLPAYVIGQFFGSFAASAVIFALYYGNCWWWVPLVAPTLGCLVGMFIYNILIDFHNRSPSDPEPSKQDLEAELTSPM